MVIKKKHPMNKITENEIDELLTRSVVNITAKRFVKKNLSQVKKLRLYIGADATGTAFLFRSCNKLYNFGKV